MPDTSNYWPAAVATVSVSNSG